MILVTLLDNADSMADGCKLTSAEVAAARTDLGIRPGSFVLKLIGKEKYPKGNEVSTRMMLPISLNTHHAHPHS